MLSFDKIVDARSQLKDIYDSAQAGVPAIIRRSDDPAVAVVRLDTLKRALRALCPIEPQVSITADGMAAWLPGLPVSAQADGFDALMAEFVAALRDYADAWVEDLRAYPNHEENWGMVDLILLSSDDELCDHAFKEAG